MALLLRGSITLRGALRGSAATQRYASSDSTAVIQKKEEQEGNIITHKGQAYVGDLRSQSGLGLGDGLTSHTDKWYTGTGKTPMQYVEEIEPIECHGLTVASRGSDDPALGCPVEYIDLRGTTRKNPAVCKYTGNKYYSLDWKTPSKAGH